MADQNVPPEAQEHGNLEDVLRQRDEQLRASNERLARMEETLNALKPPPHQPQQQQLPPGKRYVIPPQLRQQIAGLGLSDAEIEANGDLIVPFINAYLGQAAGEVLAIIQQQADDIAQLHMLRDVENFPHTETLFKDIQQVRKAEAAAGRYVPPDVAYRIALANNYEKIAGAGAETAGGTPGGQFQARASTPPPPSPAATRSRDLSAGSGLRTVRAPVTTPETTPRGKDDLLSMSREERKAFFTQNAETPIKAAG
jgi:hypothetical protein